MEVIMAFSKTIQMYIFDGNPNGRIMVNFLIGMEEFIKYQEMKFQILLIEKILKILGFIFFWKR